MRGNRDGAPRGKSRRAPGVLLLGAAGEETPSTNGVPEKMGSENAGLRVICLFCFEASRLIRVLFSRVANISQTFLGANFEVWRRDSTCVVSCAQRCRRKIDVQRNLTAFHQEPLR